MAETFSITLEQTSDYQFVVNFDQERIPALITDEGAPLGHDTGPSPTRLLAAAVGNCLAASLLFALRKFKNSPEPLQARATVSLERNAQGRMRVAGIDVTLNLGLPAAELLQLERVLAQFEDFCVVTESVRQGIAVTVAVRDADGRVLKV